MDALLGQKLLSKDGEVDTATALAGKTAVALYFSAHWCPPCRGFTPKLAEWYTAHLKAKGLEIVFVSSDQDDNAFSEYFASMPWLALPFGDREKKEALSKQFKVQGIPSVVILDSSGALITTDGRSAISSDPEGQDLPWKPKTLPEILADAKLVQKDGSTVAACEALQNKVFAFYFSAHWCPPCRGFTPKFAEFYKDDLKALGLEVVFVSSDREEAAFKDYFAEMPWMALEYSNRKAKDQLNNLFKVQGIPSVVIIGKDFSVISKEGRDAIMSDPKGKEFPWHPKPVTDLKNGPGSINEVPTLIAFCETSDAATQKGIYAAMEGPAKQYLAEAKTAGEEDPKVVFTMATTSEDLSTRIRTLLKMAGEPGKSPQLMLIDIPDNGGYYEGPEGPITEESVRKFVDEWSAKKLERKQLE